MATLIDAGLWIDLTRARSPLAVKQFAASYINDPDACLAEPIAHVAIHHGAVLVTFDSDYPRIASVSALQVRLLQRRLP
jgi:hypothetical protein